MKKTEIKIGAEYAVNPRNFGRQGQGAGDRGLSRGIIHSYAEGKYGKAGSWLVTMPDGYPYYDGTVRNVGETVTVSSRNIVAPWDQHVVAAAAREKRKAEQKAEHERDAAALNEKIKYLNKVLPESLVPRWAKSDIRFQTESGYVSVDQLLAIIDHARSEGVLDADDVTRYDAP